MLAAFVFLGLGVAIAAFVILLMLRSIMVGSSPTLTLLYMRISVHDCRLLCRPRKEACLAYVPQAPCVAALGLDRLVLSIHVAVEKA